MDEKCGCKIIFYGLMSDMGGEIKFCPLHAAAPEMKEEMKGFVDFYHKYGAHMLGNGRASQHFDKCRKLIAKAERS